MDSSNAPERGLVEDIINSIMTPGYTASGVIQLMFYAFYALFATLAAMVVMTGGNAHVIALLLLAICLFVAIRWFIAEMDHIKRQAKDEDQSPPNKKKQKKKSSKKAKKRSRS